MPIDSRIEKAIVEAVHNNSQPPDLASQIVSWYESILTGNEDFSDIDRAQGRLENLYGIISCPPDQADEFTED